MTETLLGLIALGTLTTAVLQIVVILALVRTAKRTLARVERIKGMVAPLPAHVAAIRDDVERMQMMATQHVARIATIYDLVQPTFRQAMTALTVARTVAGFVRKRRS